MKLSGDRNQCPGCGAYFNSTHAFEKHRIGEHGVDRRCATVEQMNFKGMVLGKDGFWRGSAMSADVLHAKLSATEVHNARLEATQ